MNSDSSVCGGKYYKCTESLTCHATTDAHVLIAKKAVESARNSQPLNGDYTDLVLPCYDASLASNDLYFYLEPGKTTPE